MVLKVSHNLIHYKCRTPLIVSHKPVRYPIWMVKQEASHFSGKDYGPDRASLVAHTVKNQPAEQETWV